MTLRIAAVAFASLIALSSPVRAQDAPTTTVRILVVDSAGRFVPGADVSILRGLTTTIGHGITDDDGAHSFTVPASGDFQVSVRRLGFLRAAQFFRSAPTPIALRVQLAHSPVELAGVTVTAESAKQRAYHVDADEIANSARPIFDGFDVLQKLRPDMMYSRTPQLTVVGVTPDPCTIQDVWVNGRRITNVTENVRLELIKRHVAAAQAAANALPGQDNASGIATVPSTVLAVLGSIQPEHIEEINYTDCGDFHVERAHARNAVFVVLKRGVHFEPNIGSYVDKMPLAIAGNRLRIVGVYDERSGAPVEGATIADSTSGMFIKTSETGSAHLAFLSDGEHTLRIIKNGYAEQSIHVNISATETTPITLVLASGAHD